MEFVKRGHGLYSIAMPGLEAVEIDELLEKFNVSENEFQKLFEKHFTFAVLLILVWERYHGT